MMLLSFKGNEERGHYLQADGEENRCCNEHGRRQAQQNDTGHNYVMEALCKMVVSDFAKERTAALSAELQTRLQI